MIDLTQEQRRAFQEGCPIRLRDDDLGQDVVICPATVFEQMERQLRELAEDESEQAAWVRMSMRNLAQRLGEEEHD